MISSTSGPWAWTQRFKVDSHFFNTQLLIYCSQLRMFRVWKFNWRNTRRSWPMKTFGFTQIKEVYVQPHRGILETDTTNFGVNSTSSKVEHGYQSRGYKLPKALYNRDELIEVFVYEGHCRMIFQQRIRRSIAKLMWVSVLSQRKKECKGIRLWEQLTNSNLKCKGIAISESRDQKQTLWLRMYKLSRLRGTTDGNSVGREPVHV